MAKPISIAIKSVQCMKGTRGLGNDEPYVVVVTVDFTRGAGGIHVPALVVTVTGVWSLSEGEVGRTVPIPATLLEAGSEALDAVPLIWRRACWGLDGHPAVLSSPNDVAILVALMEQDDTSLNTVKTGVRVAMTTGLASIQNIDLSRAEIVTRLKNFLDEALTGVAIGIPDHDDEIGHSQELKLTKADIQDAQKEGTVKSLRFKGGGDTGGDYWVYIELGH